MNLTINKLPTRTWNRLGMNESQISAEEAFTPYTPKAVWNEKEVLWQPNAQAAGLAIPAGAENELAELTREAGIDFAKTKAGVQMNEPLVLTYHYSGCEQPASRLVLQAEKGSTLKVVLVLKSQGSEMSAIQTEIYAEDESKVELYVAQLLGADSVCLHQISGSCGEKAAISLTKLELGAGKLYAGANIDLNGADSQFRTDIGYHARENQLLDMNYAAYHKGQRTQSLMEVCGTLEENSKKIFRGTIDFQPGCSGAKGTENENVLLLGEQMVNQTIPLILCAEEDVEGNHGASIGRLDEKILFYLSARGISEAAAQEMIARSRIEAVCSKFPVEDVKNEIHQFQNEKGDFRDEEL